MFAGFSAKHDSGNIRVWGLTVIGGGQSEWAILGGPLIGLTYN